MADDAAVILPQLPWTTLPMDAWRHAAVALHRVWVVAVTPSRRLLTRVMALQGGTQLSGGVRVDAAPEVVASVRSPPGLAMVVVALVRSPGQARKMQRRSLPLLPFLWRLLPHQNYPGTHSPPARVKQFSNFVGRLSTTVVQLWF